MKHERALFLWPAFCSRQAPSIAVVGSGVSGSAAAWALNPVHDVTLYERDRRPGGHTATVDIDYDGTPISVDTGFIVYNEANYPNLTALFAELDVTTHRSDMSFSVSLDHGRLEWSGDNLATVFAQKRNLVRPSFLLMLREILRFNRICLEDRSAGRLQTMSIGDYLNWRGFSPGFTNNYLVPMAAAIWSSPAAKMLEFPAEHFIQFFDNHRLIYTKPHPWRTVTGGSRNYLSKLLMLPPGQEIRWRILETDKDGPLLAATFSGMGMPLKTGKILRLVARIPHLTFKIVAGIHWEALKLWGKGIRIVSRPQTPELMSVWKEGQQAMRRPSEQSSVGGPAE